MVNISKTIKDIIKIQTAYKTWSQGLLDYVKYFLLVP